MHELMRDGRGLDQHDIVVDRRCVFRRVQLVGDMPCMSSEQSAARTSS